MEFQKIFGKAFRYPLNMKIYLILFVFSLLMTFPPLVYSTAYTQSGQVQSLQEMINFLWVLTPFWIISFFVGNFVAAFFYDSASRYYPGMKYGRSKDSLETAKKRYLPLLGTQILFFFIILIAFMVFTAASLIPVIWGFSAGMALLTGIALGTIAAAVTAFFLFMCNIACVIDGLGPFDSLRKSFSLVKANKANTFVFWIMLLVIVVIIGFIGSMPSSIYSTLTGYSLLTAGGIVMLLIQTMFSTYAGLFSYSANVNFYTTLKGSVKGSAAKPVRAKPARKTKPGKPKPKAKPKAKPKKKPIKRKTGRKK